jgi:hypothetical protein
MLFEGKSPGELAALGETRAPSVADLFVAKMGRSDANTKIADAKEAA